MSRNSRSRTSSASSCAEASSEWTNATNVAARRNAGNRATAVTLDCHPVEAVEVDGAPFASLIPRGQAWRAFKRTPAPLRPFLPFPGPKTWGGEPVNDIIIATLSNELFDGDERSTSRSDVARLAEFTLACSGGIAVPESFGAVLVGGQYTAANLRRFWAAALTLGSLHWIIDRIGRFYYIAKVDVRRRRRPASRPHVHADAAACAVLLRSASSRSPATSSS